jgi:RimJ/RimL family protein N-acetyltransferase
MPGAVYLRGDAVTLRTVEHEDIAFLHEMLNNPALWRGFGAPGPRSEAEIERRFEEQNGGEALLICHDDRPVGRVRLVDIDRDWGNAELTCYVAPDAQRRGFATEACRLVIGYGFDHLPVNRLTARVFDSNRASRELAETLGFEHEGRLREHVFHDGTYRDLHQYGLIESDWRAADP